MKSGEWTFFSNYAHVLVCLIGDPDQTMRDVASKVGITERAVQRIVSELEKAGVLLKVKEGRRNHYDFKLDVPMRHPLESHVTLEQLLKIIVKS